MPRIERRRLSGDNNGLPGRKKPSMCCTSLYYIKIVNSFWGGIVKRVFSVFLVLLIIFSICFECTITSSAIAGVDDVVVLGVCLDLLALGVSINNVSSFCKSQSFNDFCTEIGNHIDSGISAVKRNGKIFIATAKLAWQEICGWVKNKIHPGETQEVEFETETTPSTLTLADGTVVPYDSFMEWPFLIYHANNGNYIAWNCRGNNAGVEIMTLTLQFYCTAGGKVSRYDLINGEWTQISESTMTYGVSYMNTTGSVFTLTFPNQYRDIRPEEFWQYRTINRISNTQGAIDTSKPPAQTIPEAEGTASVTVTSDENYYPGAVEAPVEVIEDGDLLLIECPESLVIDADTDNPTITTDRDAIGDQLAITTPADVKPRVLTNTGTQSTPIDQIISDTPALEMQAGVNDPAADIETANKFRLPRSFLEGFPFSIPYSIYAGIQSFVADPQAPVFNFPFSVPALGITENVEIDLTQWNPVAKLCRALLSFVWVAALALVCSKFIKR